MEIITAEIIAGWLDQLAQFEAQRDGLANQKAALLNEVQLPAQVQGIIDAGMKRMREVEQGTRPAVDEFSAKTKAALDAIVIPEAIKEQLAEIDRKRAEIVQMQWDHDAIIAQRISDEKATIQAEVNAQTKAAYEALAQRKAEIELEFSGGLDAVDANIADLKARIKQATIKIGKTVKASLWQSVFTPGRTTWKTDFLDACYFELNGAVKDIDDFLLTQSGSLLDIRAKVQKITDDLAAARKVGEPSTQLKRVQ